MPNGLEIPGPPRVLTRNGAFAATFSVTSIVGALLIGEPETRTRHVVWLPLFAFAAPFLTATIREGGLDLERWRRELRAFRKRHPEIDRVPPWEPSVRELRLQRAALVAGIAVLTLSGLAVGGFVMKYHSGIEAVYVVLAALPALGIPFYLTLQTQVAFRRRWQRRNSLTWWERKVKEDQRNQLNSPWNWRVRGLIIDGRDESGALPAMAAGFIGAAASAAFLEHSDHSQLAQLGRVLAAVLVVLAFFAGRHVGRGSKIMPVAVSLLVVGVAGPLASLWAGVSHSLAIPTTLATALLAGAIVIHGVRSDDPQTR